MKYKFYIKFILLLLLFGCNQSSLNKIKKIDISVENGYKNSGFALIYNDKLENIKKLEPRSLDIYHKFLKKESIVKITNPRNGKYLIANVKSKKVKFSNYS